MRYPLVTTNSGELSPQIDSRSDVDKYRAGCRILENMIPRIYGPSTRRPGTKYIDTCGGVARIIPFIYSNSISYIVLLEDQKMYFYYDGGQVLDANGRRLYIDTPYLEADLFELQFKQSNDVMWIVHNDYAPRKLTRTSANAFSLDAITFEDGPFKKRNDLLEDDDVTLTPSVTTGTGTLTASSATFSSGHVGALFSITQPRVNTSISGTLSATGVLGGSSILTEGACTLNISDGWSGTIELQRSIDDGVTWETRRSFYSNDGKRAIQYTFNEEEDDILHRVYVSEYNSTYTQQISITDEDGYVGEQTIYKTSIIKGDLTVDSSTQMGICRITGYVSSTSVNMTVLKSFASTDADKRWAEGCWSPYRGYPGTITFFEERVVYAGTEHQPQTIWFSATDDYENFDVGTNDDDSFSLTISSETRNAIQWIGALEALLVGTSGGEWRIRSSSEDEALTPTNFSIKQQTSYGSKSLQAQQVGDAILFADFVGRRVRELTFSGDRYKYTAGDLTSLAEHITSSGIVDMAYQKNPDPILWSFRDDGTLLSMTYERDQNVVAWSRHPFETGINVESETTNTITIPAYQYRDEAYVCSNNNAVVWLDSDHKVLSYSYFDNASTCGTVDCTSGGIVVAGHSKDNSGGCISRYDTDLTEDSTFFVPDAGWSAGEWVGCLRFTYDGLYLYAITNAKRLYKFEVETGDEVWNVLTNRSYYAVGVDDQDNAYLAGWTDTYGIYDRDGNNTGTIGKGGIGNNAIGSFRRDVIIDNGRLYAVGTNPYPVYPAYVHVGAIDFDGTNFNCYPPAGGGGQSWDVCKIGDYIYVAGDRSQTGVGDAYANVWKFDSSLNLIASYDTGVRDSFGIFQDHNGNLVVSSGYYDGGDTGAGIWILDTDLNYISDHRVQNNTTYGIEGAAVPYMTDETTTTETTITRVSEGLGVNSVAVIPSTTEDEVWLVINRIINGQKVRYLEQMQPRDWGDDDDDQWFVDSGLDYDSTSTSSFSGLDHLEGESVIVLADGAIQGPFTVTDGAITLTNAASRVIVGLPFRYKLKPMRMDITNAYGTTQTVIKNIGEVVVSFYKSGMVEYGTDTDNLFKVSWRTTEVYGEPLALKTGDVTLNPEGGFDAQDTFILTGNAPVNCTVRAIVPRINITGR